MTDEAVALLKWTPRPGESEGLDAMNPHLCRRCGCRNILSSLELAARASEASDALRILEDLLQPDRKELAEGTPPVDLCRRGWAVHPSRRRGCI
ncbi:MAG: hypothetical protein OXH99_17180 [Bryobacterales bacterium]|nr:hypothetical protein [Bryobacterales bacterium]